MRLVSYLKHNFWRVNAFIGALFLLIVHIFFPVMAYADGNVSWDDIDSIITNTRFYQKQCGTGSAAKTGVATGKLYMIGDSITQGSKDQLNTTFTTRGFNPVIIDGVASRSLAEGGAPTDGMTILSNSKDQFKDAGVIVVALGTNGGVTDSSIQKVMDIITKDAQSKAKVYWVNVGADNSKRTGSAIPADQWNQVLSSSAGKGYTVIDWAAVVKEHPEYIDPNPATGLGVHPIGPGKQAFADTIANALTGASKPTTYNNLSSPTDNVAVAKPPQNIFGKIANFFNPSANAQAADNTQGSSNTQNTTSSSTQTGQTALSERDKIAQLIMPLVTSDQQAEDAVTTNHVGGIFVNTGFLDGSKINAIKAKSKPELFVGIDEEGGKIVRLKLIQQSAKQMGSLPADQVKKIASDAAAKLKAAGITFDAAPVVDLDTGSPAITQHERSFSTDPNIVAEKAGAFAEGLKAGGITPTFKHFPGIGGTTVNSDEAAGSTPALAQLKAADLLPYQKLLANPTNGGWVMMSNYNVPDLTNGQPASISKPAYDLLKTDYKFNGIIITDDLKAKGLPGSLVDNIVNSIKSGADIALFSGEDQVKPAIDKLEAQAKTDPDLAKRIEESSAKVLAAKTNTTSSSSDECCGSGGGAGPGATVSGTDAEPTVWNFLVSTKNDNGKQVGLGFSAKQAAGVMGNLKQESGFNSTIVNPTSGAYGLGQWLGGRLSNLQNYAASKGKDKGDLNTQLEFLQQELEGPYKSAVLDPIKASPDDEGKVTRIWLEHFEIPCTAGPDCDPEYNKRIKFTEEFLAKYGSGTGSSATASGGVTSGCSGSSSSSNLITGGFSLPVDKKFYDEHPNWFSGPHHDYPASDIPVPTGTPIYSMTAGKIIKAPTGAGYGNGVTVDAGNGVIFIYGHGSDGGSVDRAHEGDTVTAGQLIMNSDNTGDTTGPHVHVELVINGKQHCPQDLFKGIVEGNIPDLNSLPTSGCTF